MPESALSDLQSVVWGNAVWLFALLLLLGGFKLAIWPKLTGAVGELLVRFRIQGKAADELHDLTLPNGRGALTQIDHLYPALYVLTRVREARDWATGLALRADLLGKNSSLEVHHIFPKSQLYKAGYGKAHVNAVANFCFLTKDANLEISDTLPERYFPKIEERHPGVLASQWIPQDPELWRIDRYRDFLQARKELLAAEANRFFDELLHGDDRWLAGSAEAEPVASAAGSSIEDAEEESALQEINRWLAEQGLAKGEINYEHADPTTGDPIAVLDMAWPDGLQEGLSQPVALLLDYDSDTLVRANEAGYRCFTSPEALRRYVHTELIATEEEHS